MFRSNALVLLLMFCAAGPARADTWADKLFKELSFDFGAVPRGQQVTHSFPVVNNTQNTVHIASVRTPMGPATVWALKHTLAPGEETSIVVGVNSGATNFYAVRSTHIFVQFDEPLSPEPGRPANSHCQ